VKNALFSFVVVVVFVLQGTVFAQRRDQNEAQIKLQHTTMQRLQTKVAQQQSQIAELQRLLAERDTELHSLLRLISNQSNQPGQNDVQPPPDSSNKSGDHDEDDDSDDSACSGPLFARGGSIRHNSGNTSPHRGYPRLNPKSHDKVSTHNSISGVPEM